MRYFFLARRKGKTVREITEADMIRKASATCISSSLDLSVKEAAFLAAAAVLPTSVTIPSFTCVCTCRANKQLEVSTLSCHLLPNPYLLALPHYISDGKVMVSQTACYTKNTDLNENLKFS